MTRRPASVGTSPREQRSALLDFVAGRLARPSSIEPMLALPTRRDPQFVVPATPPSLGPRALLTHNRLRRRETQLLRVVAAVALGAGIPRVLAGASVDRRAAPRDPDRRPLIDELALVLGVADLTFAIGLSRFGPYAKPVLQLFDRRGRVVGYAKVGWTDVSAAAVRNEGLVLEQVEAAEPTLFRAPRVLHRTDWDGIPVVVIEPLPRSARRVSAVDFPMVAPLWELAAVGGPVAVRPVRDLPVVHDETVAEAAAVVVGRVGDVELPVGRSHGDLVTWNAAVVGNRLWLWDWEHSAPGLPVGFDVLHGFHQHHVDLDGRDVREALVLAAAEAAPHLRRLGLDDAQAEAVRWLHRLEQLSRFRHASLLTAADRPAARRASEGMARVLGEGFR